MRLESRELRALDDSIIWGVDTGGQIKDRFISFKDQVRCA